MFIQTEATPNPATLKFLPGRDVMGDGTLEMRDSETAATQSPLAEKLFAIDLVVISSRSPRAKWNGRICGRLFSAQSWNITCQVRRS
jgi:Scaffold protein Nfu/NifU N terminal